jgi:hypothetical protein
MHTSFVRTGSMCTTEISKYVSWERNNKIIGPMYTFTTELTFFFLILVLSSNVQN